MRLRILDYLNMIDELEKYKRQIEWRHYKMNTPIPEAVDIIQLTIDIIYKNISEIGNDSKYMDRLNEY